MSKLTNYSLEIEYLEEKQFTKCGKTKDYYGKTFRKFYLDNLNECFDRWEFYLTLEKHHNIKILYATIAMLEPVYVKEHIVSFFYNTKFAYHYEKTLNGMEYVGK